MAQVREVRWDALFTSFRQGQEAKRLERAREQERSAWYEEQTRLVMELVREVAQERAAAFERHTGAHIEVRWPSRPPINVAPEGPFMSFLSLAHETREVHLYSHRVGGAATIHFVVTTPNRSHKRVHGRPGCRIERREHGGFLLRDLAPPSGEPGGELGVDELTFRAFEALLSPTLED
jgi:hypothetical protein